MPISPKLLQQGASGASTQPDSLFLYTTLYNGDGTNGADNNTFVDSSDNPLTITKYGNATQGTYSPYGDSWSTYLYSSGYMTFADSADFDIGAGDFCLEMWVFRNSLSPNSLLAGQTYYSDGDGFFGSYVLILSSGYPQFVCTTGGTPATQTVLSSSTVISTIRWNHIAVCRSGTTLSLYLNGTRTATTTYSSTIYNSNYVFSLGNDTTSFFPLNGSLSNVRLVKGSSPYDATQSTITVPTSPLTAISGTTLLTCQSRNFVDNSTNPKAITRVGTPIIGKGFLVPTVEYSKTTLGGSGYFDGVGDYLSIPANSKLALGTGDYTVSFWINPYSWNSTYYVIYNYTNGTTGQGQWKFEQQQTNGKLKFYYDGTSNILSTGVLPVYSWTYVSAVRSGTTVTLYFDGVSQGTATSSATFGSDSKVIYMAYGYDFPGYISDFRMVSGSAITTVPTSPVTSVANTKFLCNFTNAGIINLGPNGHWIQSTGNTSISTSIRKYGTGSIYFDGTGYLKCIGSDTVFGTSDFTVEFWMYPMANSNNMIFDARPSAGPSAWIFEFGGDGYVRVVSGESLLTSSTKPALNTWSHIALVRINGTMTIYINGVNRGSGSIPENMGSPIYVIGASLVDVTNGTGSFVGYIDDFRATRYYARYTTNFVPPTRAYATYGS